MEELLKQLVDKPFKPSNYTVYNIIEDDGFISELFGMYNEIYGVGDFEYIMFDLTIKEKNGILYRMSFMMNKFAEIKKIIEKEIQDNPLKPKARLYVDKDKCFAFVVKLKEFDLKNRLLLTGKIKIDNDDNTTLPIYN